ncbi:MAG: AIR synthase family protein [Nitrososphaerales archaeon]
MALPLGKVPPQILESIVLKKGGAFSPLLLVKPKVGVDIAVIALKEHYLILSSDPITGVAEEIGWYAVNVAANDVATSGARPMFLQSVILLPEGSDASTLKQIAYDMHKAAKKLGISITGGHTETVKGLKKPIVISTCFSVAETYVTSADARLGDVIMMTKAAALEGTSILARFDRSLKNLPNSTRKKAINLAKKISIVEDALTAYSTGYVHAMHDPTEGGVIGGLCEMAVASGLGFIVYRSKIPVLSVTREICGLKGIDPLLLISSGSLLMAVDPNGVEEVKSQLKCKGISVAEIGRFTASKRIVVDEMGKKHAYPKAVVDELWRLEESEGGQKSDEPAY